MDALACKLTKYAKRLSSLILQTDLVGLDLG